MQPVVNSTHLGGVTILTVLATVKEGLVPGAVEPCTYLRRLQLVLRTLNAVRLATRESALGSSPFPDFVARFDIVHFFRFTIVPPDAGPAGELQKPGRHRLLLSVIFDGGWEPYMRVIWRDLGTTLDLMFCNCDDYPIAHHGTFEDYIRWVRSQEVPGGFFYADSMQTVADRGLLESLQGGRPPLTPAQIAAVIGSMTAAQLRALGVAPLKGIGAFHALSPCFPATDPEQSGLLLRATHDIFWGWHEHKITIKAFQAGDPVRDALAGQLAWFEQAKQQRPDVPFTPAPIAAEIQGGILESYKDTTHGCLALLRVTDRVNALEFLKDLPVSTGATSSKDGHIHCNVAFTFQGLRALGVPDAQLAKFPQEFVEGMSARAGILGDFRGNHPDHWTLPERNWPLDRSPPFAQRIELAGVDVVVQFRGAGLSAGSETPDEHPHPTLARRVAQLEAGSGLEVLGVQAMRRFPAAGGASRDHFGFEDGFSQPKVEKQPHAHWDDSVRLGEVLLGYGNDRGDLRVPKDPEPLLDNGTFLVVRKLKQDVGALNAKIDAEAQKLAGRVSMPSTELKTELLEMMMGRRLGGDPLAAPVGADDPTNDFNYANDRTGARCPFQSHVRRANPRDPDFKMPRILRRGMSYGPRFNPGDSGEPRDRGVMFMAYNASIAEQFEKIQRWISGGNSSGTFSGHGDPICGVPQAGVPRPFRLQLGGQAISLDLGDTPFVRLEWGLYLFVPSPRALKTLAKPGASPAQPPAPPAPQPQPPYSEDFLRWQRLLEDQATRDQAWGDVRARPGGVLRTDYGVLVGDSKHVMDVFRNQGDRYYSVCGYGERMKKSIGLGYLGEDADAGHSDHAPLVNAAIEQIKEPEAFGEARTIASDLLQKRLALAKNMTGKREAAIDIAWLSESVLAGLCALWFGLPDGKHMQAGGGRPEKTEPARCPGDFFSVSRYVFSPRPGDTAKDFGKAHGALLLAAVKAFLADPHSKPGSLSTAIKAAIGKTPGKQPPDLEARTIAGVMLGFPPTVNGNLRSAIGSWLIGNELWALQQELLAQTTTHPGAFERAQAVLRGPLTRTMMKRPVPDMLWRVALADHKLGEVEIKAGDRIVLGLLSASQQSLASSHPDGYIMFGGDRGDAAGPPIHACPGYAMAMGAILGVISALLEAGSLRSTGSGAAVILAG